MMKELFRARTLEERTRFEAGSDVVHPTRPQTLLLTPEGRIFVN
jgi:hypothetical protein